MDNQKQDMHGTMLVFDTVEQMATSEESGAAAGDDHDALDEVVLSSVNQALEAVENEALQESAPAAEEPPQAPRNVIPELEEVEDPEEMVESCSRLVKSAVVVVMSKVPRSVQQGHRPRPIVRHGVVQSWRFARSTARCSWGTPVLPNLP